MPARGRRLEALVLPISQLEEKEKRIRVHHERMFARPIQPVALATEASAVLPALARFTHFG
jgi:hypothetical protein